MDVNPQLRSEPRRFPLPVADQRHRAHDQRRRDLGRRVAAAIEGEQRQDLNGLAQAHVVGEHATETDPVEERQPGQPALLVRPQGSDEAGGRRHALHPLVGSGRQQLRHPALALDADHRQPSGLLVEGDGEPQHLGEGQRRLRRRREQLQPALQPARIQLDPAPAHPHERLLQLGEPRELLGVQALLAEGDLPAVVDESVTADPREPADRARLGPGARPQPGPEPGRRPSPPAREVDAEPGGGQHGRRLAEERVRARGVEHEHLGPGSAQGALEIRVEPARAAQLRQQRGARRRHQAVQHLSGPVARPHLGGRRHDAGLGRRLQGELEQPHLVRGALGRLDQPEPRPGRAADHVPLPSRQLAGQGRDRAGTRLEAAVPGGGQGDEPGGRDRPGRRRSGRRRSGRRRSQGRRAGQCHAGRRQPSTYRRVDEIVERPGDDLGRRAGAAAVGALTGSPPDRQSRRREGQRERAEPAGISSRDEWTPHGAATPGAQPRRPDRRREHRRQHSPAGGQVLGQSRDLAQVLPRAAGRQTIGQRRPQRVQGGDRPELRDRHLPGHRADRPVRGNVLARQLRRRLRNAPHRRHHQLTRRGPGRVRRAGEGGEGGGQLSGVRGEGVGSPCRRAAGPRDGQGGSGVLRPQDQPFVGFPPPVQDEHRSVPAWHAGYGRRDPLAGRRPMDFRGDRSA